MQHDLQLSQSRYGGGGKKLVEVLEYAIIQGPVESRIVSEAVRRKQPIPEKFADAPALWPGLDLYYQGFQDLISSRITGMGVGPIWWSTVQHYCEAKGLDEEQTESMHYHVREMDTFYLSHLNKKSGSGNNSAIQSKHKKKG